MSKQRKIEVAAERASSAMRLLQELRCGLAAGKSLSWMLAQIDELGEELVRIEDAAGAVTPAALFGE